MARRSLHVRIALETLGLAVAAALLSGACGGGSAPSAPSTMPTPPPRSIEIAPGMPASGTSLSLGSCGFGLCTKALAYAFVVTYDASLATPVFRVRLLQDDGTECLSSYRTGLVPLLAGRSHSFDGDTLLLSTTPPAKPGVGVQNCAPPFATSRMVVELRHGSVTAEVLLAREFDVTYHWVQ